MSARFVVRLFGSAREAVGEATVEVELERPSTAGVVLDELGRARPALAPLLPRSRVAVDRAYVDPSTPVEPDQEIAVLPPVGGG